MSGNPTTPAEVEPPASNDASERDLGSRDISHDDRVLISFSVPEPANVITLLNCAQTSDIDVQNVGVIDPSNSNTCPVEVDLGEMTQTQWETLELAFSKGYYHHPRETSLEELSCELGISKSAVSQRLNGAERKLIQSVFRSIPAAKIPE